MSALALFLGAGQGWPIAQFVGDAFDFFSSSRINYLASGVLTEDGGCFFSISPAAGVNPITSSPTVFLPGAPETFAGAFEASLVTTTFTNTQPSLITASINAVAVLGVGQSPWFPLDAAKSFGVARSTSAGSLFWQGDVLVRNRFTLQQASTPFIFRIF